MAVYVLSTKANVVTQTREIAAVLPFSAANFIVLFPGLAGYPGFTQERAVLATFGRPGRTYGVGSYTMLVWNRNLLRELRE